MRTQVGIVGAGPAGLTLARILETEGIESVVVEARSREYCEQRIRAGVVEQRNADLLREIGVGARLEREGIVHDGIHLQFEGERHRMPFRELTGRSIVIYGQTEIVKDLIAARARSGLQLFFEADDVAVHDLVAERPRITFVHEGRRHEIECDVLAGCDGFHGICRHSVPAGVLSTFEREYPFAWLGILADVEPSVDELVYAHHERGFALLSLRSPQLSRYYVQVAHDEDIGAWPDDRIWEELRVRTALEGWTLRGGARAREGGHRHEELRRRADAVRPPLPRGRCRAHRPADRGQGPEPRRSPTSGCSRRRSCTGRAREATPCSRSYSSESLRRVWRAEHFSWWMTSMLHRPAVDDPFDLRLRLSQLRYVTTSESAARSLAENYVGLEAV